MARRVWSGARAHDKRSPTEIRPQGFLNEAVASFTRVEPSLLHCWMGWEDEGMLGQGEEKGLHVQGMLEVRKVAGRRWGWKRRLQ